VKPALRRGAIALVVIGALIAAGSAWRQRQAARTSLPTAAAPEAVLELGAPDVVRVREVELAHTVEVSGGLKAVDSAFVKARVPGEVQQVAVREGDAVRRGQVLVRIDPTELDWRLRQAEHSAAAYRAQLDIAQRALDNNRALVAQGFISATALDNSVSSHAAAQANLNAAMAAVELARKARADAELVAPIDGVVAQRLVQPGERVPVDARLLEIVDPTRIELEAAIPPGDAASLRLGAPASLHVDGIAEPVRARIARINPSAQAGSRSVPAYLALEPQPGLRPGLFAQGTVELARVRASAAPLSSVRFEQSRPYVLLVEGPRAVQRPVTLGRRGRVEGDEWVEVAGVPDGSTLLAGGVGTVRDGTPVRLTLPPAPGAPAPGVAARQP
jgi:RND family efflux transporter MFP subunit